MRRRTRRNEPPGSHVLAAKLRGTARVHPTAAVGFAAGAATYDRARPTYPDEAVEYVLAQLQLPPDATVLDLAAGTGKLTRLLVERGVRCIAVEPSAAMRRALTETVPRVWAFNGTAEDIPLETESVDGVTVAQAFHWFRFDEALAEIHRVSRSGARLAIAWNARDVRVDWVRRVTEIVDRHAGTVRVPRYRDDEQSWMRAMAATTLFRSVSRAEFPFAQLMTPELLVERAASVSFVAASDPSSRERVLDEVRELARTHPDLAGRERFEHPYVTEVYVYERLDSPA